jgi:hypothetical protein
MTSKTEKRLQELVDQYKKSGNDYSVENPNAVKILVKRDVSYKEHRNVV